MIKIEIKIKHLLSLLSLTICACTHTKQSDSQYISLESAELRDLSPLTTSKVKAPDFVGISSWINSPQLTMEELRGKIVLVDFWTYSCINCIRTFPYLNQWYEAYKDDGFVIIGVHSPEFSFEHDLENVQEAVKKHDIHYPIALDNNFDTWRAYSNRYWPSKYLINKQGYIVKTHVGEGNYLEMENAIRQLLNLEPLSDKSQKRPIKRPITQETYLGNTRANSYAPEIKLQPNKIAAYDFSSLNPNEVGIKGLWRVGPESITAVGSNSILELNFIGSQVHLVMSGKSATPVRVYLDHLPVPEEYHTEDSNSEGNIVVQEDRKYDLVNLRGSYGRHTLTLIVPPGISAYAFTFGNQ